MKFIFATILLLTSLAFSATSPAPAPVAQPAPFGAFTYKNYLYVTYLADCNTMDAQLDVSRLCHKDRLTRNLALNCDVQMNVASTRMICPEMIYPPKVFIFDLANEPIAREARELVIRNGEHAIKVKVNRR